MQALWLKQQQQQQQQQQNYIKVAENFKQLKYTVLQAYERFGRVVFIFLHLPASEVRTVSMTLGSPVSTVTAYTTTEYNV